MISTLEIRVLGPFEVLARGRPVGVSGRKRHALLALLALRRRHVVSVDTLIDALWGDDLPASPRNALQHHVARLRAALGPESILASPDGYALNDATVDALRVQELLGVASAALREGDVRAGAESAAHALALWRGPALHGLTDTVWFAAEARRLEALRVDALEEQFEAALALGQHREIVSSIRETLEDSPFRERLWGQLILALYRSGRQADALETFQEARRVLLEELGLEPGSELRRLQEAILAHEPAIAAVAVAPLRRGNLPAPSTSFVGREEELAEVVRLLREHRVVTLTGPPGVGKSRLALETARSLEDDVPDGVRLVDLAQVGGSADAARLLADAVDARGAHPLARATARLRDANAIIVLDACEHVIVQAAQLASALLAECPSVRVLATSREALHVDGEARFVVEPLAPPGERSSDVASPAVQLFAVRARAARPGFELTAESAPLVFDITRRLDGLPLAIELAAARVNVLGLPELRSIVERRLGLLHEGSTSDPTRTALERLVEWSYDHLLHADEKTLLQQVAVHRGGASLASLVALGEIHGLDEATVTYLLGALVDKSIVSVAFPGGDARYNLLDSIRDYVLERLAESGGLAAARKAPAEYFASLVDGARRDLRGRDWRAGLRRLELEHDNLWAALIYACETPDPGLAIRLAAPAGFYFALAERVSEGRRFLEFALVAAPDDGPTALRVELLAFLCYLATEELDLEAAIEAGERALAHAAEDAVPLQVALAQMTLALAAALAGDEERAAALADEARAAFASARDDWGIGASSLIRAEGAAHAGDVSTVAEMVPEILMHSEAIGYDAFLVPAALLEGWVADRRKESEAAVQAYGRALELAGRTGFSDHASFALAALASHALANADLRDGEKLARRALAAAEGQSAWAAAHARVVLAQIRAAAGDVEAAEKLYRDVVDWSGKPRPYQARESLFVVLADSPVSAALLGLAGIADGRGDAAAADDLRSRAGVALL